MTDKCAVCGGPTTVDEMAIKLKSFGGYQGGAHNPGGAQLFFDDGPIQISSWCDSCDLKKVEKILNNRRSAT